jgi:hypothetical protein
MYELDKEASGLQEGILHHNFHILMDVDLIQHFIFQVVKLAVRYFPNFLDNLAIPPEAPELLLSYHVEVQLKMLIMCFSCDFGKCTYW